jgi:hypothetical protein
MIQGFFLDNETDLISLLVNYNKNSELLFVSKKIDALSIVTSYSYMNSNIQDFKDLDSKIYRIKL